MLGILVGHLERYDVLCDVGTSQWDDGEVAQDIVLVDAQGSGLGTYIHQCATQTTLTLRKYGISQCLGSQQYLGHFYMSLLQRQFQVLLHHLLGNDVEEVGSYLFSCHSYRIRHQTIVNLVFLWLNIQDVEFIIRVCQVLVADREHQVFRDFFLTRNCTAHLILYGAQRPAPNANIYFGDSRITKLGFQLYNNVTECSRGFVDIEYHTFMHKL